MHRIPIDPELMPGGIAINNKASQTSNIKQLTRNNSNHHKLIDPILSTIIACSKGIN